MNRTPRSASRRASRQLAANVPGLRRVGAVELEDVVAAPCDRSVTSGTLVCIRNAISYCAMRDFDLRVELLLVLMPVERRSACRASRARPERQMPSGLLEVQDRVLAGAELHALVLASRGSRCPRAGRRAAGRPCPRVTSTTNAGRFSFIEPRP